MLKALKKTFAVKPLYVRVTETRYDLFGDPTNFWNAFHKAIIEKIGINESVEPGWYDFTVKRRGIHFYTSLTPRS